MNIFYLSLKKLCLILVWLTVVISANAQSINNYVFSTNTSSSLNRTAGSLIDDIDMNTGTTNLIGGSQSNFTTTLQNIGFDFFVNGTRVTQFNVTSNGWVGLGTFASTAQGFLATTGVKLAPFLGATTSIGTSSIGRIHSKVVGAQPNRVLVVEFLRMAIQSNVVNDTNTFQVRLYEATGAIEYVYGRMKITAGAPLSFNVGFQFTNTIYQHVNTSTHTSSTSSSVANSYASNGSIPGLDEATPGSQRAYTWIPNPINDAGTVIASAITTTGMTLSWNNVSNEVGYALYRSVDGGLTYSWVTTTGVNVTTFNATGLLANTTYNWRVYALRESISAPADGVASTLPATKFFTVASGNWNNPSIWNTSAVPSAQDSAEISTGHNVVLDATTVSTGTLIVKGNLSYWSTPTQQTLTVNGDVIVDNGGVLTVGTASFNASFGTPFRLNIGGNTALGNISGNLIVDGTLDLVTATNTAQVAFFGIQNSTVTGAGAVCELPMILVDKGALDNTIEFLRTYSQPQSNAVFTGTQRLTVTSGTLKISAPVVTNSFSTTSIQFASTVNARLWLNNAGINMGMHPSATSGQMFLTGELRIDNGTLSLGLGNQQHNVSTNGTLRVNGGTLNLSGALQILNTNTARLFVEGGRITIDPQATGNLGTFVNVFSVNSLSGFTFSSGSIEIIDPHSVAGGTSINIASGGTKLITGGTFVIGNDATSPSGGTLSATSGFAINSAYPIYRLHIKNNISVSASRFCRLLNNLTIIDSLIVFSNGYLQTASGFTGFNLTVLGGVLNNGSIAGVIPGATGTGLGSLVFEGTVKQTVSGTGLAPALSVKVANPAGVDFINSNAWALDLITLQTGNVNNLASSLAIGGATYRGDVVIGGLNETTTAGTFAIPPTINTTFGSANFTYGPAANTLQTGSFNEIPAGAITMGTLTVNDEQGLVANRNISLVNGLNLTSGILNMGNNALTLGTSAINAGILTRGSGLVQLGTNGTFTRWFAAATSPDFGYASGFPLSNGTSERSLLFSLNGGSLSSGGNLTVRHVNSVGFTEVGPTYLQGSTTINRRTNTYWKLTSTATPDIGIGNTLSVRVKAAGIGAITNVSQIALVKGNDPLNGTHQDGTGTVSIPEGNRDFSQPNVLGGAIFDTIYIGTNSAINPLSPTIIAIATGNWNNTATWENGTIPTISNSATIAPGVNVTIPTGYTAVCNGLSISAGATLTASAGNMNNGGNIIVDGTMVASGTVINVVSSANNGITINDGGSLTVSNGTVNLGPSGGSNRTMLVESGGTLTVSGGTLNINGNLSVVGGASFNQSGGDINIDGNSGSASTSTAQGIHLVSINSTSINCNAGNLTIIDPPHNSIIAGTTNSLRIQVSAGSLTAFTGTHTVRFGNGTSTETGNANGFVINTRNTVGIIPLQNVIVNAGNGSGRWVSTSYTSGTGTHIKGNLTINTAGEFRHTSAAIFAVGGDIVNNGTLTCTSPVIMGGNGYIINNAQAIGGTGTFRNSLTTPTGAFTNLSIDNGNSLTLNTTNVTFGVSGILALGALKVITNTNTVALTSTGSLTRTTGYIVGNFGKHVTAGSNVARTFEIGTATDYLPVTVTYPSVTTAGTIALGINTGEHPQIATSCINAAKSVNMNWKLANTGTVTTGGNYTFNFTTGQVDVGTLLTAAKLFVNDGTSWKAGLTGTATSTSFAVNGLNIYGDVAIGEITPVPASVVISASSNNICVGTNVTFTASITNGGDAPTYQWKVNGVNTVTTPTFASSTLANNDVVTCAIVSNSPCVSSPNATSNTITMTVSPLSVGGTVTGGTTICSGSNSGLLTLAGQTGSVVKWQSANNAAFTGATDIVNTSTTYTSGALTANTYFRAVVQSGTCAVANSSSTLVTVDAASVAGTISGTNTVCSGASAGNLTLSGNVGNVVRWESAVSPFTVFTPIANTTTTQSAGNPTQTIHYRAVVKNGSCAQVTTSSFIITVTPASVGGSVASNQTICAGGTVATLNLTGNVGSVTKWQSANNAAFTGAVDIANTTTSLTPTGVTTTTYYRAVVASGGCAPANSSSALITVNPAPVGGAVNGTATVCSGSSPGTLTLSGHSGTITGWQSNSGSGWVNISNTTTTYNPGNLTVTTSFRAILASGTCTPDTSIAHTVTVTPASVGGSVASNQTICAGGTVATLNLTGNVGSVTKWQSANNAAFTGAVDIANTTTSLTPTGVTTTTYYRAVVASGGCAPANSSSALITVNPAPVGGAVNGTATVCSGSSPGALTLSGHSGTITGWQSNSGSGWVNISNTTTTYNPGNLTVTTSFRAILASGTCTPDTSIAHTVTVSPVSVGGTVSSDQTICSGGTVAALNLTGNVGSVTKWQSANNAAFTGAVDIANTTTTLTPTGVTTSTYFRAVVTNGTCAPVNSAAALITVAPASVGGTVSSNQTICSGGTVAQLTLTGNTGTVVKWQSASDATFTTPVDIANTSTTYTPTGVTSNTYYRAVVQNGSCASANSSSVLITVNPGTVAGVISGNSAVCSSGSVNLTLSGNVGNVVKWQSAVAPFSSYTDIANTTTSLTTGSLTQTTRFRAVVQNGTCNVENSNEFEVSVTSSGVWLGVISSSWNNAGNWCGGIPTSTTNVVIPSGTANSPVIDLATAAVNNITVDAGATLSFTGTSNTLDVKGNLIVNGTFNTANGTVEFSGGAAQNMAGITYNNLKVNSSSVKTFAGNATVTNNVDLTNGKVDLNGSTLTISTSATITNASANSYFITGTGGLKQFAALSVPKLYPLGSVTSYNPITINNNGTTGNYTLTLLDNVYNSYTGLVGSGPITANVVSRTLNIDKDFVGSPNVSVTVQWNTVDEASLNRSQLIVGRYNGGVWSNISGAPVAAGGSNPYSIVFNITETGIYGIGDINSPLPVKLIAFTAKLIKGSTKLAWTTASEINNNYFDIERSIDGHQFEKVGTLKAKGNSNSRADYAFIDATSPEALKSANVLYYRLKQVDISGKFDYSNVLSVSQFENAMFEVIATVPNPFNDETTISYKTSNISQVDIHITDAFGKLIKTETINPVIGANNYKLMLDDLNASGVYFVKITQDGRTRVVKAIKK